MSSTYVLIYDHSLCGQNERVKMKCHKGIFSTTIYSDYKVFMNQLLTFRGDLNCFGVHT